MAGRSSPPPRENRASAGRDPLVGAVVASRYRIVDRLASGGMGTVYRAEQLGLERLVALKILDPRQLEGTTQDSRSEDDLAVLEKRFSREAAMLARLAHPNVVTVFDYGSVQTEGEAAPDDALFGRRFYMAMELLSGETLQQRLSGRKRLGADETVSIGWQIGRALRAAHEAGIVHRDLKPANVMIVQGRDGEELVKLLDFGIGKIVDPSVATSDPRAELTQEGRFVGSPLYMSPEQIAHGKVDARTDIYSLGVLLYRCLAGAHPFQKENTALVMLAHLNERALPLREKGVEVPAWLDALILRCLEKEANRRPQTMEDVLRAISDHTSGLGMSAGWPSSGPRSLPSPLGTSGALPIASTPHPAPAIRVDEEVPTLTGPSALPASVGTLAEARKDVTPHTHNAAIMSERPPPVAPAPARGRGAIVAAAIVLVLGVGAVAVFALRTSPQNPATTAPSTTPTKAPVANAFTLILDSVPAGAEVSEGGKKLGTTPLQLSIDDASVHDKPRTFVIEAPGHQPYTLVQGPSAEAVHVVATLAPELAATESATAAPTNPTISTNSTNTKKTTKPPPTPPASAKPSVAPPPTVDIQLKR